MTGPTETRPQLRVEGGGTSISYLTSFNASFIVLSKVLFSLPRVISSTSLLSVRKFS